MLPSTDSSESVPLTHQAKAFSLSFTPTSALLVTNLPYILFASTSDLEPLLFPFGTIKKLEIIALPSPQDTTSALVEYNILEEATDAKQSLQGQYYAQYRINAEYVVFPDAPNPARVAGTFADCDDFVKPERHLQRTDFSSMSAPPSRAQSRNNHSNVFSHKRPLQDISNSSSFPHHPFAPPSVALYAPKGFLTRSDSINSRCVLFHTGLGQIY
jgi:RNA recognition motif-containing protein